MSTVILILIALAFAVQSVLIYRKLKSERASRKSEIGELSEKYFDVCQQNDQQTQEIESLKREAASERALHDDVVLLQQHTIVSLEGELAETHSLLELALDPSTPLTLDRAREMFVVRNPYPIQGEDQERVHQERPLQGSVRSA